MQDKEAAAACLYRVLSILVLFAPKYNNSTFSVVVLLDTLSPANCKDGLFVLPWEGNLTLALPCPRQHGKEFPER